MNKVCVYKLSKEQEYLPIIINIKPTEIDSSCIEDIIKLNEMDIYGVIVGKAFYEGRIQLTELAHFA